MPQLPYVRRRRPPLPLKSAWRVVDTLAEAQAGALGRQQLMRAGVPGSLVRRELQARRWQRRGAGVVVTHNGPLLTATRRWAALLQVGSRAALNGVTALQAAGLTSLVDDDVHVITPKSSTPLSAPGVVVHESRRFREDDVLTEGPRRTRPAVAAVHGALWASTDREATYLLVLTVQQRVTTAPALQEVLETVLRSPRRRLLHGVVADLSGGVRSMGELDIARDFRRAGLPEPDRQVVRVRANGRTYLDVVLESYGVRLELDGAGHDEPWQRLSDVVRDLGSAAAGEPVIRIPMTAYRLDRARVLRAVADLLRARGWSGDVAA